VLGVSVEREPQLNDLGEGTSLVRGICFLGVEVQEEAAQALLAADGGIRVVADPGVARADAREDLAALDALVVVIPEEVALALPILRDVRPRLLSIWAWHGLALDVGICCRLGEVCTTTVGAQPRLTALLLALLCGGVAGAQRVQCGRRKVERACGKLHAQRRAALTRLALWLRLRCRLLDALVRAALAEPEALADVGVGDAEVPARQRRAVEPAGGDVVQ